MDRTSSVDLAKSLDKWTGRVASRRKKRDEHRKLSPEWWRLNRLVSEAKKMAARREKQLANLGGVKPKLVRLRAPMVNAFGSLGPTRPGVGHYTAGPRDTSDRHGVALYTEYNAQHRRQGWGAIGYHLAILSSGTILLMRPTAWKGAHTAGQNTGRIGVCVPGGPGQRMTTDQRESLRWLKKHGHTSAMPSSHRLPVGALDGMKVHNDLGPTACPGDFESDYKGV